ncbi:MAG: GNAT family N-acetyltransferase, partial [Hyphomicrobiaceae bacterium]
STGDYEGEIYEFYVAPLYQGLGLGEILFEAARTRLETNGKRGLIVWALADNDRAQSFYERRGGIPKGEVRQKFTGKHLIKTAYAFA